MVQSGRPDILTGTGAFGRPSPERAAGRRRLTRWAGSPAAWSPVRGRDPEPRGAAIVVGGPMADSATSAALDETEVGSYFVANYPPFSVWTREAVGADALPALARPPRSRRAARALPPHPVLPQAVPLLLLQGLHGQERERRRAAISTRSCASGSSTWSGRPSRAARSTSCTSAAGRRRFSRRSSSKPRRPAGRAHALDERRGDHLRVRARHAHGGQARRDPPDGRHAAEPRRRELRRPDPRAERTRAPLARDRQGLRERARAGLPAGQHRPDRGHAGRDRRRTGRRCVQRTLALEPDSITIYQMELPFNTTISRDRLSGTHTSRRPRPTGRPSGAGSRRPSRRSRPRATT